LAAEGCQLVVSGEVQGTIGGDDSGEEAEVIGDSLGQDRIGGGGEIDGAAGGVLLLQILKEFAVVREVGDVEGDGGGEVALECGLALEEPSGELKEGGGVMAGEGQGGVDEGVGLDERAVQIDAEWVGGGRDKRGVFK
jgi:hypothetical protein